MDHYGRHSRQATRQAQGGWYLDPTGVTSSHHSHPGFQAQQSGFNQTNMATQPSGTWEGHDYPQPDIMPMVQPNSFLPSETLPQNNMGLPTPVLQSAFHPFLPHLLDIDTLVSHLPPQDHFSHQLAGPSLDNLQSSRVASSEGLPGSQESFTSTQSTPPDLSPCPFNLDNLDPLNGNAVGDQDVPPPGRDVDWGQLSCGLDEELGANVSPAAAVAPAVGLNSDPTFRCSCCRKHQPAMKFSRDDGGIPTEQTRYKACDRCRTRTRAFHEPKRDQSGDGSQSEKPCIICRAQRPVEDFPMVGSRSSRRCSHCSGEGRQPEERPLKRPRSGSKESTSSSSRASPTPAVQPGHACCSGCSKTQAVDRFVDPRREGHLLRTCLQCRTRKNTADRKKREQLLKQN